MSQQKAAALRLAHMGYRVFQLIPGDKPPAVSRFPLVATTDTRQIEEWWTQRPDCNIGVSTTGFVVVDIDTKKGPHALQNFLDLGGSLNETFTVRTATGGYHCYYNGPDSRQEAGLAEGIDIRSHHGYVVGPGSVMPHGEYTIINNALRANCPIAIEIALRPPGALRQRDDSAERDEPLNILNAEVWLKDAEPAIEGRGGNNATFQICAKLVRDYALSVETTYQLLVNHWNPRCFPPWSPGELMQIIRNADDYGTSDLGVASPVKTFGAVVLSYPSGEVLPAPSYQLPPVEGRAVFNRPEVHMGNAIPLHEQTARPWKVEKMFMNGDLTVLGGMGSAGKSFFQLTAYAHFALGKDFGEFKLKAAGAPLRTVVYNGEDNLKEQSLRLAVICSHYNFDYDLVKSNLLLLDDRPHPLLIASALRNTPQLEHDAIEYIIRTARRERADLIGFDPLLSLHTCDENNNSHIRFVANALRDIARDTNTAVMVAHHTGKGASSSVKGDTDIIRGASSLIDRSRIALIASKLTKEDKAAFGISDENFNLYFRVDVGKTNMFRPQGIATAVLYWQEVRHHSGELVGVPVLVDTSKKKADHDNDLATVIMKAMRDGAAGSFSLTQGAQAIQASDNIQSKLSESSLRTHITTTLLPHPVVVGKDILFLTTDDKGKPLLVIR